MNASCGKDRDAAGWLHLADISLDGAIRESASTGSGPTLEEEAMRSHPSRYAPVLAAMLVAGCGGDGGGGSAPAPPTAPPAPALVEISLSNQDMVARASVASILPFSSVTSVGAAPVRPAGASVAATLDPTGRGIVTRLTKNAVDYGTARTPSVPGPRAQPLAALATTQPCAISGAVTVTLDDRDGTGTLTSGDALSTSYAQCSDWPNSSTNGVMTISFTTITETSTSSNLTGSITYQQFMVTDQAASLYMNGAFSFTANEAPVPNGIRDVYSFTVLSTGFTVASSGGAGGYADTIDYRGGYRVTEEDFSPNVPNVPATSVITANGNFKSNALGGDLSLTTTKPFLRAGYDENPREGQLTVNGLNDTKLSVTAGSSSQARMDVCDDGDGAWEGTKMVDWSSLVP